LAPETSLAVLFAGIGVRTEPARLTSVRWHCQDTDERRSSAVVADRPRYTGSKQEARTLTALGPRGSSADTIARLDALATELNSHGWTSSVKTPRGGPPRLYARNPEPGAAALSESIYARPRTDGKWSYWWPWAEPIAETAAAAAAVIVRVLHPAGAL
jgi:hypothetical protein